MRAAVAVFAACIVLSASSSERIKPSAVTQDLRCWHNIIYGPRENLPDEGAGFRGRIGNWCVPGLPWRMATHKSGQRLDIYAPAQGASRDAPVVLFLHGGAWSQPFDKDAIPVALLDAFLAKGFVVASADYILQSDVTVNGDLDAPAREGATFEAMLRDVDAAAGLLKRALPLIGVEAPVGFAIAGESAGGHLALLYAYDQGCPERLGLGLGHAFRVTRAVAIAAPVDFASIDGNTDKATVRYGKKDLRRRFRILLKRLVGGPDDLDDAELWRRAAKWSPKDLVSSEAPPTVLAYGQVFPFVPTDGAIPVSQMEDLEAALKAAGVPCAARRFLGSNHAEVAGDGAEWIVDAVLK